MIISGSQLTLSADYYSARSETVRERLRLNPAERGGQRGDQTGSERDLRRAEATENDRRGPAPIAADRASLSALARARAFQPAAEPGPAGDGAELSEASLNAAQEEALNDPNLIVLLQLIERLTGRAATIFEFAANATDVEAVEAPPPPASGPRSPALLYQRDQVIDEVEISRFSADGVIRTADGQEIRFSIELEMRRHYHLETSERLQVGPAPQRKDPLVINFAGNAAQLQDQRFSFDLDADGSRESLALLGSGSGFLSFDRNRNGVIDNGSELFGALSGDGYADLARLDSDGNGWIDQGDAAFAELRLWLPAGNGPGRLIELGEAGIAAIGLANIATPFALRGEANQDLGQIRATGVYLAESGAVGTTQQIDLSV